MGISVIQSRPYGVVPFGQTGEEPSADWIEYWTELEKTKDWPVDLISFEMWCAITMFDDTKSDGGPQFQHMMASMLVERDQGAPAAPMFVKQYYSPNGGAGYKDGYATAIFEDTSDNVLFDGDPVHTSAKSRGLKADVRLRIGVATGNIQHPFPGGKGDQSKIADGPILCHTNFWQIYGKTDWLGKANFAPSMVGQYSITGASQGKANSFETTGYDTTPLGRCNEMAASSEQQRSKCVSLGNQLGAIFGLYFYKNCNDPKYNWTKYEKVGAKTFAIRFRIPNPAYIGDAATLVVKEPLLPANKEWLGAQFKKDTKAHPGRLRAMLRENKLHHLANATEATLKASFQSLDLNYVASGFPVPRLGRYGTNKIYTIWDSLDTTHKNVRASQFGPYFGRLGDPDTQTSVTWNGARQKNAKKKGTSQARPSAIGSYHLKNMGICMAKNGVWVAHTPRKVNDQQEYQMGYNVAQAILLYPHYTNATTLLVKGNSKTLNPGYQPTPRFVSRVREHPAGELPEPAPRDARDFFEKGALTREELLASSAEEGNAITKWRVAPFDGKISETRKKLLQAHTAASDREHVDEEARRRLLKQEDDEDDEDEEEDHENEEEGDEEGEEEGEEDEEGEEGEMYEVDKIVCVRKVRNKWELKVHWKGYDKTDDTWEADANVTEDIRNSETVQKMKQLYDSETITTLKEALGIKGIKPRASATKAELMELLCKVTDSDEDAEKEGEDEGGEEDVATGAVDVDDDERYEYVPESVEASDGNNRAQEEQQEANATLNNTIEVTMVEPSTSWADALRDYNVSWDYEEAALVEAARLHAKKAKNMSDPQKKMVKHLQEAGIIAEEGAKPALGEGSIRKTTEDNCHFFSERQQPWPHSACYEPATIEYEYGDPMNKEEADAYQQRYGQSASLYAVPNIQGPQYTEIKDAKPSWGVKKPLFDKSILPARNEATDEHIKSFLLILAIFFAEDGIGKLVNGKRPISFEEKQKGMLEGVYCHKVDVYAPTPAVKFGGKREKGMDVLWKPVFKTDPRKFFDERATKIFRDVLCTRRFANSNSAETLQKYFDPEVFGYDRFFAKFGNAPMKVCEWVTTPWHYEHLPYRLRNAVFKDGECYSEGCTRCSRPFFEYGYVYYGDWKTTPTAISISVA